MPCGRKLIPCGIYLSPCGIWLPLHEKCESHPSLSGKVVFEAPLPLPPPPTFTLIDLHAFPSS